MMTQDTTLYGAFSSGGFRLGAPASRNRTWGPYGTAMPYPAHFTYSFIPPEASAGGVVFEAPVSGADGAWLDLNIGGVAPNVDVWPYLGAPYSPLDEASGTSPSQAVGSLYWAIQLAYPSILKVSAVGLVAPTAGALTIFGYDFYGQFLQCTVALPTDTLTPTYTGSAFYGVVGVWYNGGNATANCKCHIEVSNRYGLPYVLADTAHIINFGQSGSGAGPQELNANNFVAASFDVPGPATGDVRGIVKPSSPADGVIRTSLTYYLQGGDPQRGMWSQIAQGVNPSGVAWNVDQADWPTIPSLDTLCGLTPYFTGTTPSS